MNNEHAVAEFPPSAVARNLGRFSHDLLELSELQAELLKTDAQACVRRLVLPVSLLVASVVTLMGAIPVGLAALAFGLVAAGLSPWLSLLIASVSGLLIAVVVAAVGWRKLRKSPDVFARSKQEFVSNVSWVKHVLSTMSEN